jgi:hypothetical protein
MISIPLKSDLLPSSLAAFITESIHQGDLGSTGEFNESRSEKGRNADIALINSQIIYAFVLAY